MQIHTHTRTHTHNTHTCTHMHTPATVLDAAAVLIRALVDTVLCELIDEVPISGVELQPAKGHRMRVWDACIGTQTHAHTCTHMYTHKHAHTYALTHTQGHRMRVWDTQVSVPVRDDPTLQCFFWTVARPPQKSRMTTSHNRDLTH
jgi:hypothetical protein